MMMASACQADYQLIIILFFKQGRNLVILLFSAFPW